MLKVRGKAPDHHLPFELHIQLLRIHLDQGEEEPDHEASKALARVEHNQSRSLLDRKMRRRRQLDPPRESPAHGDRRAPDADPQNQ